MINIRQFFHFIAVLENSSILKASRQLNISQPALSKSIGTLEEYFGVRLFDRLPRGVEPTAFAYALERHARRIIKDDEEARDEMTALAAGSTGRINAGTGASFIGILTETIAQFRADRPGTDFTILTGQANDLRSLLLGNQIDLYVGMANQLRDDPAVTVHEAFTDRFVGICSYDHPFAGGDIPIDDLLRYNWIVPEMEEAGREAFEAFFVANKRSKPRFEIVTNVDAIVESFLRKTDCLSIVPEASTRLPAFRGLAKFTMRDFTFLRHVGIVRRRKLLSTPLLNQFTEVLADSLRQMAREIDAEAGARHDG